MSAAAARPARQARRVAFATMFLLAAAGVSASAQPRPAPRPVGPTPRAGSWEIGGGVVLVPGFDMGDQTAELTRNPPTGSGSLEQFRTSSELGSAVGLLGKLAIYLSPKLAIEGGVRYARPVLDVRITGDFEDAPDETASETLNQWVIEGSALWHFAGAPGSRQRLVPFVIGGAGYVRELDEEQLLTETGVEYHAGAGVKYWFGTARRRFGLRGEAGISIRDSGFDFEDKVRTVPIVAGSIVYLF